MLRSFRCWLTLFAVLLPGRARAQTVSALAADYLAGYQQLHIPDEGFDYQANLRQLPPAEALRRQSDFFLSVQRRLAALPRRPLSLAQQITYDHLAYEAAHNLRRVVLETAVRRAGTPVPATGLAALPNHHAWYALYAR